MTTYFALDGTLMKATPIKAEKAHLAAGQFAVPCQKSGATDYYNVIERPLARKMIADVKRLGDVAVLTTASSAYAKAALHALNLNIQVIAREDYMHEVTRNGESGWELLDFGLDPKAVLVDNGPSTKQTRQAKLHYLGIAESRCMEMPTYIGGEDAPNAALHWHNNILAIREHANQPEPRNTWHIEILSLEEASSLAQKAITPVAQMSLA